VRLLDDVRLLGNVNKHVGRGRIVLWWRDKEPRSAATSGHQTDRDGKREARGQTHRHFHRTRPGPRREWPRLHLPRDNAVAWTTCGRNLALNRRRRAAPRGL